MHIDKAVKQALEVGGEIYRKSAKLDCSDIYATVKPTNSYDTCILIAQDAKGNKRSCRNWNPTAEDLIADDWKVLGNEAKNNREDWIEKQNKRIFQWLWIVFVSMITATITVFLATGSAGL